MVRRALAHIALLVASVQAIPCTAQNLVPNPSFELYNTCPNNISGLDYSPAYSTFSTVRSWVNPLQQGSADFFHSCAAANTYVSVPGNAFGYQQPKTGDGYLGMIAWEGSIQGGHMTSSFAEYVQCRLTQPMKAGERYCVNMYVNNAVSVASYNFVGIEELSVNFSSTKTNQPSGLTLSLAGSISNTSGNFLTDTANWMKVTAIYTATGGEEWMTIGWFDNGKVPTFQPVFPTTPTPGFPYRCYLFLDDVSVMKVSDSDTFYSSKDTSYCKNLSTGLILESKAPMADYSWSNGAISASQQVKDTGTYWCVATSGCYTYIDTFIVHHDSTPKLFLGPEIINCKDEPVTITSNYQANNYSWNTGAVTHTVTVSQSGRYWLTTEDKCGIQSDTINVVIQPPTEPPLAVDTTICQFVSNPKIKIEDTLVTWYTHYNGNIGSKIQPPLITIEPTNYSVYITRTEGRCESDKVPVSINIQYTPHEELGDKSVMCENDIQLIGKRSADVQYKWNTGSDACCVLPTREGLYQRAANNECGSYIDSVWVYLNPCDDCIEFPNAFTPVKGYGNELFRPLLKCPVNGFHIRIFNRWGNMVYESKDVYEGWNGRHNYEWAPLGTYVYMVEYTAKGKLIKQQIVGNVTLLR